MEKREFCNKIFKNGFKLKSKTKTNLKEKIILFFIKKEVSVDEVERICTIYKMYKGNMYILNQFVTTPRHYNCRHTFEWK